MQQVHLAASMDVEAVERELGVLWRKSAEDENDALVRARVANLLAIIPEESGIEEVNGTLEDLSTAHPSRALVVVAERDADDRDIDLFISSFSQKDSFGRGRLCCEELVLIARGKYVPELPSVAVPLLVSDLPTFLWWRDALETDEKMFQSFCHAADRLVIDSAESSKPHRTIASVARLFDEGRHEGLGISDINWARLTSWRSLLASFYDAPRYQAPLASISDVVIDYTAPSGESSAIAPQAVLLAGWLMSRLGWELAEAPTDSNRDTLRISATCKDRRITVQLNRIDRSDIRPGRLARAELTTEGASFVVNRDRNGKHLETRAIMDGVEQPGRVLPVRNRSTAQLLARELEILCNDNIYAEAVAVAAKIIAQL
jgi:glucose-6-phosphate dehydrogenase assembly protein OpcA